MPFQDLLKKQINHLGKELEEVLERTPALNDPDLVSMFVKETDKKLTTELHGSLEELAKESPENLRKLLTGKDSDQMENLEKLADIFAALGQKENFPSSNHFNEKALSIYQFITEQTATFSFSRGAKIAALKNR